MDGEALLVGFLAGKDLKGLFVLESASVSCAETLPRVSGTYLTRLAGGGLPAMLEMALWCRLTEY